MAVTQTQFDVRYSVYNGSMIGVKGTQEYKKKLGQLRKWEIKEWITKLHQSGVLTKLEFEKKTKMIESELFEDTNNTRLFKSQLGMVDIEQVDLSEPVISIETKSIAPQDELATQAKDLVKRLDIERRERQQLKDQMRAKELEKQQKAEQEAKAKAEKQEQEKKVEKQLKLEESI